jgi:hypothetical protein
MNVAGLLLADHMRSMSRIALTDADGNTTWIQVAKTGTFHSPLYGVFSITQDDLRTMLRNYQHEHPIAPTELMLDYEHLSANPDSPSSGEAAGWFKQVELRSNDHELWARVELTDEAADKVRKKKYRYISPEIARKYKSKRNGRDIGFTLRAAALTNRPFLEGMEPVSLQLSDARGNVIDVATLMGADVTVLPYSERERRVREAVDAKFPPAYKDGGVDFNTYTWVRNVFEDRVVFSRGQKTFAQDYEFNDDLSVTFNGEAIEVTTTYTPVLDLSDDGDDYVIDLGAAGAVLS